MAILLTHPHVSGQIGCPELRINGRVVPARQYDLKDHLVEIDGDADVIHHDVATLLELGFSHASPAEQEAHAARKRKRTTIQEAEDSPPEGELLEGSIPTTRKGKAK